MSALYLLLHDDHNCYAVYLASTRQHGNVAITQNYETRTYRLSDEIAQSHPQSHQQCQNHRSRKESWALVLVLALERWVGYGFCTVRGCLTLALNIVALTRLVARSTQSRRSLPMWVVCETCAETIEHGQQHNVLSECVIKKNNSPGL